MSLPYSHIQNQPSLNKKNLAHNPREHSETLVK